MGPSISIKRLFPALALLVVPAAAPSMPPPLGLPTVVLAADEHDRELGEAFITVLRERGYFAAEAKPLQRSLIQQCAKEPAKAAACVRGASGWKPGGAAVVVIASGASTQTWTCVGIASAAKFPDRQQVELELKLGLFGTAEQRKSVRDRASRCITAAGAESGW